MPGTAVRTTKLTTGPCRLAGTVAMSDTQDHFFFLRTSFKLLSRIWFFFPFKQRLHLWVLRLWRPQKKTIRISWAFVEVWIYVGSYTIDNVKGVILFPDFSICKAETNSLRYPTIFLIHYVILYLGLRLPKEFISYSSRENFWLLRGRGLPMESSGMVLLESADAKRNRQDLFASFEDHCG